MKRTAEALTLLIVGTEGVLLAALNVYAFAFAQANHTGLPLGAFGVVGSVGAVVGGVLLALGRTVVERRWTAVLLCLVSAFVAINVKALEWGNILMEYDTWARKGMPG